MPDSASPQRVRIVTDVVAAVPPERAQALQIGVLPVYLNLEGQSYLDDGSLDLAWFYEQLETVTARPTTAAPSPQDILDLFNRMAVEGASEIIALFAARQLSSIYNHAVIAARQCAAAQVHLVDTQQISLGEAWFAIEAAEMAQQGATAAQIVLRMRELVHRVWIFGVIDAPDYLHRSGRISWWAAAMAGLLRIKPIIGLREGQVLMLDKVRTMRRALRRLTDRVAELGDLERIAVVHTGADPCWTQELVRLVQPFVPAQQIPVLDTGAIFATHVGPRAMGVALVTAAP